MSEQRRHLEGVLLERVRDAEKTYRSSVVRSKRLINDSKDLECNNPDGVHAFHTALTGERRALERYRKALATLTDFLLYHISPSPQDLLGPVLHAAIQATGADRANIQIFDRSEGVLKIAAQSGFERPFLEFFARVDDNTGSCGAARKRARRVVVEDVIESPIFAGTPSLQIMIEAEARAVQSTPLLSPSGKVVGMFSTHYRKAARLIERDFTWMDQLAREATALIIGAQSEPS